MKITHPDFLLQNQNTSFRRPGQHNIQPLPAATAIDFPATAHRKKGAGRHIRHRLARFSLSRRAIAANLYDFTVAVHNHLWVKPACSGIIYKD
jgi:hypothetical protein